MDDLKEFKKKIISYIADGYDIDGTLKWLLELDEKVRDLEEALEACRKENELKFLKRRKKI